VSRQSLRHGTTLAARLFKNDIDIALGAMLLGVAFFFIGASRTISRTRQMSDDSELHAACCVLPVAELHNIVVRACSNPENQAFSRSATTHVPLTVL
jgi:hypothetical protein